MSGGERRQRDATKLGEAWWAALKAEGLTQKDLAERIGTSRSVLADIVGGRRSLSVAMALRVERALGRPGLARELLGHQVDAEIRYARLAWLEERRRHGQAGDQPAARSSGQGRGEAVARGASARVG